MYWIITEKYILLAEVTRSSSSNDLQPPNHGCYKMSMDEVKYLNKIVFTSQVIKPRSKCLYFLRQGKYQVKEGLETEVCL